MKALGQVKKSTKSGTKATVIKAINEEASKATIATLESVLRTLQAARWHKNLPSFKEYRRLVAAGRKFTQDETINWALKYMAECDAADKRHEKRKSA